LKNPEPPPDPELKNPDDGLLVEFPKPGAAGITSSGMVKALISRLPVIVRGTPLPITRL